jgi:Raf kinase inhibitor-like YbhB/YbcL family protein
MAAKYPGLAYFSRQLTWLLVLLGIVVLLLAACKPEEPVTPEEGKMELTVTSSAFQEGESIPVKYTCEGQDISPPIKWAQPPIGTRSFALIVDDPDAPVGVFTHWVVFNLPADSRELPEAVPTQPELAGGALQGKNDFGRTGYGGPCPPSGRPHRYQFTLYALEQPLDLKPGASKQQVLETMQGRVLAQGRLTGTYQR